MHQLYMKTYVKLGRPPAGLRIRIHFIRIRIQHFRLNTDPDPIQIQDFNDQKLKKITAVKHFLFDQKLQFTDP
jgi:hypothetical protein